MRRWTRDGSVMAALLIAVAAGCGGDGDGGNGPPQDPLVIQRTATASGDGQTGNVSEALGSGLRILITRASEPQSGVDVAWATADGGSLNPASSATDADGIATTAWTLGPDAGTQTATATVSGADGSPVSFTATAEDDTPPPPPPPPPSATIEVLGPTGGNRFEPADVTIQAGQSVLWSWPSGSVDHNVVPDDVEPTSSGGLADGPEEYTFTFDTPGTYNFHCANHGGTGGAGMSGTVTVQ
jgi:plastocyanin